MCSRIYSRAKHAILHIYRYSYGFRISLFSRRYTPSQKRRNDTIYQDFAPDRLARNGTRARQIGKIVFRFGVDAALFFF